MKSRKKATANIQDLKTRFEIKKLNSQFKKKNKKHDPVRNFVAAHSEENRASTHRDKKNDYQRKPKHNTKDWQEFIMNKKTRDQIAQKSDEELVNDIFEYQTKQRFKPWPNASTKRSAGKRLQAHVDEYQHRLLAGREMPSIG